MTDTEQTPDKNLHELAILLSGPIVVPHISSGHGNRVFAAVVVSQLYVHPEALTVLADDLEETARRLREEIDTWEHRKQAGNN